MMIQKVQRPSDSYVVLHLFQLHLVFFFCIITVTLVNEILCELCASWEWWAEKNYGEKITLFVLPSRLSHQRNGSLEAHTTTSMTWWSLLLFSRLWRGSQASSRSTTFKRRPWRSESSASLPTVTSEKQSVNLWQRLHWNAFSDILNLLTFKCKIINR